jgi:hypothetical protein
MIALISEEIRLPDLSFHNDFYSCHPFVTENKLTIPSASATTIIYEHGMAVQFGGKCNKHSWEKHRPRQSSHRSPSLIFRLFAHP